jgi:hypothetical protein
MDDLITCGILAVALFFLMISGIMGGLLYCMYIVITALITGNYTRLVWPLLVIVILVLSYGITGVLLAKLEFI